MKAIVQDKYGPPEVLELREIDKPVVKDDEVLLRVHAAAINPADWAAMSGVPYIARLGFGLLKPRNRVGGSDVAGEGMGRPDRALGCDSAHRNHRYLTTCFRGRLGRTSVCRTVFGMSSGARPSRPSAYSCDCRKLILPSV